MIHLAQVIDHQQMTSESPPKRTDHTIIVLDGREGFAVGRSDVDSGASSSIRRATYQSRGVTRDRIEASQG